MVYLDMFFLFFGIDYADLGRTQNPTQYLYLTKNLQVKN